MRKRQFKGGAKPRTYYDRKIRRSGFSRILAVTKLIPKSWEFIRIYTGPPVEDSLILYIEKLYGTNNNAQNTRTHKKSEQNTPKPRTTNSHKPNSSKS